MSFVETLKLLVTILPVLIDLIKHVEDAIPGKGTGEQKLALVRAALEQAYTYATPAPNFEAIWPVLQKVIMSTVSVFNTTGVFKAV